MPNKGKSRLAATDKVLLKYFFWFSLALSVLLLSVRPSVKTAGMVLSVVALGMPLFKNSQAQKETDTVEPGNSPYAIRISGGWWLFLTACAFIMPFAFGWTPGKDPIFFHSRIFWPRHWVGHICCRQALCSAKNRLPRQRY